ncbi:glycerophosphodiester phosphodiesterase GDPDL7-like [Cornus florida]|uniref:glycerophosphodiester phosphodiesterase GDPDL7-like n=1 Tax=Cornus florida TaxID=4283 RepID=UPI0028963A80|nr:glycerophosphodiester phosphodiesterase GDPDL7-like [Cornus florida]
MIRRLFFVFLLIHSVIAQNSSKKPPAKKWLTLNGGEPVVIARGGYSGLFPDSSQFAYRFAASTSLSNVIVFCDLQVTKDGNGICQTSLTLENSTTIALAYPKRKQTYDVNGKDVSGWFALDFTSRELFKDVYLTQNIYSRSSLFDGMLPLSTVQDAASLKGPQFWLNVQYDTFYTQHKLSVATYVESALRSTAIHYISSPEIGFLKAIGGKVNKARTKLIFRILKEDAVEPTTNHTYGSIIKDLSMIKSFASGILVPKEQIWPVDIKLYLQTATSLVEDAHKEGLEVYASTFANDIFASYNYSYDPTAEYLQYIDNSQFSVDGLLSDFPSTASESIACIAQNKNVTLPIKGRPLIITNNGASGLYAGCTDLAYQQAIDDGADIIDCSVQMSKDGVAFCLNSADLAKDTTALSTFMSRSTKIPEIQNINGIFSFDLTWKEITTLKPQLTSPLPNEGLQRSPANKNKGNFVTLSAFLEIAKTKAVTGILINIENAAYLASKKGLGITDVVATALSNATFDKQSTQKVLIQSDDSSVLSKFKNVSTYQRVMSIKEQISAVTSQIVDEIKKYADAVTVQRSSIIATSQSFTKYNTSIVESMHRGNVSVYVSVLRNEFITLAIDFFSDPMVELATYSEIGVDGIVTEFPATATAYIKSPCSDLKANLSYSILPIQPGSLLNLAPPEVLPPAVAPAPALNVADVVDPPLPPVSNVSPPAPTPAAAGEGAGATPGPAEKPGSSSPKNIANIALSLVAIMLLSLLSMG